ncbi:hypothetical protein BT67DRAFT_201919 [Trichocladium antarcticum]|uniref:Uncharacterized protein n=1 Tax=Trichocladium antarcticum TaxID=1450529 RepID=A0AAN6ZGK2_9PEZI|nr:hypothetical protein BT67DRAFT_201919 [Trichocladium antarcticum]
MRFRLSGPELGAEMGVRLGDARRMLVPRRAVAWHDMTARFQLRPGPTPSRPRRPVSTFQSSSSLTHFFFALHYGYACAFHPTSMRTLWVSQVQGFLLDDDRHVVTHTPCMRRRAETVQRCVPTSLFSLWRCPWERHDA